MYSPHSEAPALSLPPRPCVVNIWFLHPRLTRVNLASAGQFKAMSAVQSNPHIRSWWPVPRSPSEPTGETCGIQARSFPTVRSKSIIAGDLFCRARSAFGKFECGTRMTALRPGASQRDGRWDCCSPPIGLLDGSETEFLQLRICPQRRFDASSSSPQT